MKRLSKILMLVLTLALLVGAVFTVAASAADSAWTTNNTGISGVTQIHRDFTGESYEAHKYVDGYIAASPQTSTGSLGGLLNGIGNAKFGHLRTVTTSAGNTYLEAAYRADGRTDDEYAEERTELGQSSSNLDSLIGVGQDSAAMNAHANSYYVVEFDMSTATKYPNNISIVSEVRHYNSDGKECNTSGTVGSSTRVRKTYGNYNAESGKWTIGDNEYTFKSGEWVHITIVVQSNNATNSDGEISYGGTVGNIYVNGEYAGSVNPYSSAYMASGMQARQYYLAVGYVYGDSHVGVEADDSFALDNFTVTVCDSSYATGNEALLDLFSDDPVTDITDLGDEIAWTSDYEFPDSIGDVIVSDDSGEYGCEDGVYSFESAMQFIKDNELEAATITLYANQYNPVYIDYPVELTIDLNSFTLQNGWEVPDEYLVSYDADTGVISVVEDPSQVLSVNYYNTPYGGTADPVKSVSVALGRDFVLRVDDVDTDVIVNANKVHQPTGEWVVYNEDGEQVEITTVTGDEIGATYSVYPVYETLTFANNVAFKVELDGVITYYDSTDLWAAKKASYVVEGDVTESTDSDGVVTKTQTNITYPESIPAGAEITLLADCTISKALYTIGDGSAIYIDLNGYELSATTYIFDTSLKITKSETVTTVGDDDPTTTSNSIGNTAANYLANNQKYYMYSSVDGAKIATSTHLLYCNDGMGSSRYNNIYFGWKSAKDKGEGRITCTFGSAIVYSVKGALRHLYFNNMDMYNTTKDDSCLIGAAQQRGGLGVHFEDVNLYSLSNFIGHRGNSGAKDVELKNTNIYGAPGTAINDISGAAPTSAANIALTNSKIYNMAIGETVNRSDTSSYIGSFNSSTSAILKVVLNDTTSRVSTTYDTNVYASSGVLVAKPESVVIDGVTYSTIWGVGTGEEPTATFNIYDDSFANITSDSTPDEVLAVVEGYWFATIMDSTGDVAYDYENYPEYAVAPAGFSVYDSEGNAVAPGAAVAGQTYTVCHAFDEVAVYVAVIDSEGNVTPYYEDDLYSVTIPEGATAVLIRDCYVSNILTGKNNAVDLNGNTVYTKDKVDMFCAAASTSLFIYSSKEGASIEVTPSGLTTKQSGYLALLKNASAKLYIGYVDANTKSENEITVCCGALAQLYGAGSALYLNNLTIVRNGVDNYGFLNIRGNYGAGRYFVVDNCDIYSNTSLIQVRDVTDNDYSGTATFNNCNIYNTDGVAFDKQGYHNNIFNWYATPTATMEFNVYLNSTNVYGGRTVGQKCDDYGYCYVHVTGDCELSRVESEYVTLEDGKMLVPERTPVTFEGIAVPSQGRYGNDLITYFAGEYQCWYKVGTESEYKATAFQNMTLDTNVVGSLYIPAMENVVSVLNGEVEILDTTLVETINGLEYYVLSYGVAPKYGDQTATLTVVFDDDTSVAFEMSVARYAKMLLSLDPSTSEYIADSQEIMKYVLNYIKEVAVAFGGADASTIFADLGDISVDTTVEITEQVQDTSAISSYVTHAALDLDAYAGFAFKVASGFVGEITLSLPGVDAVTYTFSAEEPASASEVITLENVPVHIFRGDVTITVAPAEGEAVSAAYNLATYAQSESAEYINALYAYSVKAKEYNSKYPSVGTAQ